MKGSDIQNKILKTMKLEILVRINNEDASNARDAMNRIAELRPGDAISVDYLRKGEIHSTRATAGLREQN